MINDLLSTKLPKGCHQTPIFIDPEVAEGERLTQLIVIRGKPPAKEQITNTSLLVRDSLSHPICHHLSSLVPGVIQLLRGRQPALNCNKYQSPYDIKETNQVKANLFLLPEPFTLFGIPYVCPNLLFPKFITLFHVAS